MAFNYLNLEKRNVKNFPTELKYIRIIKPNTKDKETLKKYKETINSLKSGYVNLFNNGIATDDIKEFGARVLFEELKEGERLFYIEPKQSVELKDSICIFSKKEIYNVSEFNVVKEIKSSGEFLNQIIEDFSFFDLVTELFCRGACCENNRKKSLEIFNKFKEKDIYFCVNDLIKSKNDEFNYIHFDFKTIDFGNNNNYAHDYISELINSEIITLTKEFDIHFALIERLLRLGWFDLTLDVLKSPFVNKESKEIRERKQIIELLRKESINSEIEEIIKILNIELNKIVLVINEYNKGEVETKIFDSIDDVKTYLIKTYDVPYKIVSGKIDVLVYENYKFYIE